mgnify:CR=1 FL=1
MALQVRLRHPLGERLIDLESRGPENPLVVGRAGDAHVQIPSTQVAPVHCHLYEHDGQWVVADAGGGQIAVNGQPVNEPTIVDSGDVITLGRGGGAPRLEIDPLGRRRRVSAAAAAPDAVGTWDSPQPQAGGGYAPAPATHGPPSEWDFQAVPSDTRYYVPKPQKSASMVGVAIIACAVAALAGGAIIYSLQTRTAPKPALPEATPEPKVVIERTAATKSKPNHIFDFGEQPGATPPQTGRTLARGPDPTPVVPVQPTPSDRRDEQPTSPPPAPPATGDAAWMEIVRVKRTAPLPIKIYRFLEYAQENPNSPRLPELESYLEEELDLLWWFRIKELCDHRDDLQKRIEKASGALAEETNPEWRKNIEDEIARLTSLRQRDLEVLTREMGYRQKETPNLFDQEQLARLRAIRDADAAQNYANWKEKVKLHVKRTRGQLPWEMSR